MDVVESSQDAMAKVIVDLSDEVTNLDGRLNAAAIAMAG